ncbi:MAG: flavin reductase family protein [Actinomycetota bacterium]|nr:flavin reductase family protein [Actinomycetota bacterium]
MPPDPDAFRAAVGRFVTGVAVVTTRTAGLDHAMTVNAFTSVSLDPLLVLFCVDRDGRFHDAVTAAGVWGVSVLDQHARPAADWLSTRGRPLHGQLDSVPHHRGAETGVVLLDDALATLECRTSVLHPGGDHTIVVGEVLALDLPKRQGRPLLWWRGRYHILPGENQ